MQSTECLVPYPCAQYSACVQCVCVTLTLLGSPHVTSLNVGRKTKDTGNNVAFLDLPLIESWKIIHFVLHGMSCSM